MDASKASYKRLYTSNMQATHKVSHIIGYQGTQSAWNASVKLW